MTRETSIDPFSVDTADASAWSAVVGRSLLPLAMSTDEPESFRAGITGRVRNGISLATVRATSHIARRGVTPSRAKPGAAEGSTVLCCIRDGDGFIRQHGREAELAPGRIVFYDSDAAVEVNVPDHIEMYNLVVPHTLLSVPAGHRLDLAAQSFAAGSGLSAALVGLLDQVDAVVDSLDPALRGRTLQNIAAFMDTVMRAETGASEPASDRFRAFTTTIESRLDDPALAAADIAAANFVSVRTLHAAFADEGTTLGTWIRRRRLERCAEELRSPGGRDRPIWSIAAAHGFTNPSSFAQQFRSWAGVTPSAYRHRYGDESIGE